MAPFVHFGVVADLGFAMLAGWNDGLHPAFGKACAQPIGIEGFVGKQCIEGQAVDQRSDAHDVIALSRHQHEAHQIAERIDQDRDLGGQPAFRAPDGLILSPPLAPVAFW